MSISLNNHESRIAALESKINSGALSGWTSGSGNGGYWLRENTTGVIIQHRRKVPVGWDSTSTIYLPRSFSDANYSLVCTCDGTLGNSAWVNGLGVSQDAADRFRVHSSGDNVSMSFIAIGYLVSNRILSSFISPLKEVF